MMPGQAGLLPQRWQRGLPNRALNSAVANSQFFKLLFEKPVVKLAKKLPSEVVTTAQERGRVRDIGETSAELLEELSVGAGRSDLKSLVPATL